PSSQTVLGASRLPAPASGREFVSRSRASCRGSRLGLLIIVGVVAVGSYYGGTAAWYEWRFRSAVRAERGRDFDVAARELNACLRHRPDNPRAHLLAARLGWRSRVGDLGPAAGWGVPVRQHRT